MLFHPDVNKFYLPELFDLLIVYNSINELKKKKVKKENLVSKSQNSTIVLTVENAVGFLSGREISHVKHV